MYIRNYTPCEMIRQVNDTVRGLPIKVKLLMVSSFLYTYLTAIFQSIAHDNSYMHGKYFRSQKVRI